MQTKQIQKIRIYDYDQRIERTQKIIHKELPQNTVQIISDYYNSMITESLSKALQLKHLQTVLNLSRFLGKDWNDVTRRDIDALVAKIVTKYSEDGRETHTTHDHKKVLKIFFRWIKLGSRSKKIVGDPQETSHILMKKVRDKIIREDLLTEDDRTKLLYACRENVRDRAFIDCHLEAGTRPGEILNLQIRHVKFDQYGAVLHVDGKTGARTIRLIKSVPNLAAWLNSHPFREDQNAPLWPSLTKNKLGKPLTYHAANVMIKRRCEIANITKRVHLNLFRHTEATQTAKFMTEAQLKKRHGWTPESKMPARYVHLIQADVDEAIFNHYGIKKLESKDGKFLPKKCIFCQISNASDANRCISCGKPFDLQSATKLESDDKKREKLLENRLSSMENTVKMLAEKFLAK